MITFYGMFSPNVFKVALLLEELNLPYRTKHISAMTGENRTPEFLQLNPIGKLPVIVDHDDPSGERQIFESGSILMYLAENYGQRFLPRRPDDPSRWSILQWMAVQISLIGPMLGQFNHFQSIADEKGGYAYDRYKDQATFVYATIDEQLRKNRYVAGPKLSIADFAVYPWTAYLSRHGFDDKDFKHLVQWRSLIDERPATLRALATMNNFMDKDGTANRAATPADVDRFFNRSKPGPMPDTEAYMALGPMTTARLPTIQDDDRR